MTAAADEAAAALTSWLVSELGPGIALAEPPTSKGEGFDSEIHLVRYVGEKLPAAWRAPLVLRVKASVDRGDEAQREAVLQCWLADQGYPAPRVLRVFPPGTLLDRPVQVMERAPGALMLEALLRQPWRARSIVGQLAEVHARLHVVPTAGCPADDEDLLDRRLRLVRSTVERVPHDALATGLARVEELGPRLRGAPVSVCHGDFHPLNVLVAPDSVSVIDWTDAGLGDRHGDVARTLALFRVAHIVASSRVERLALRGVGPLLARRYRRAYERRLPLDDERLRLWMPVHLLHGWSQVVALHAGLFAGDGTDDDARAGRVPPGLADVLQARFDRALALATRA